MFKTTSIVICLAVFVCALSRSVEDEEIGHGLRLDSNENEIGHGMRLDTAEEIGHGLRLDKRAVESANSGISLEDEEEVEELVGHGIKSNHAWKK